MAVSTRDKTILREVARKVAEIAALPRQQEIAELWRRLNNLERVRPMVLLQDGTSHETGWKVTDQLRCEGEFAREAERFLRQRIYSWQHVRDDCVWEAKIPTPIVLRGTEWSIQENSDKPDHVFGAKHFNAVIHDTDEPTMLDMPTVTVDWEETNRRYDLLNDALSGLIEVVKEGPNFHWIAPVDVFIMWRGIEQTMLDMIDRPQWLHRWIERVTQKTMRELDQFEQLNILTLNSGNYNIGPGGLGFTDLLPQADFDGRHVRAIDSWGYASTQIFSEVSPAMHEEFALRYEKQYLARFGLAGYGCCEPLDRKVALIRKHVPHLRRISMSPKANVERGAAACRDEVIFSYKPNPTIIGMEAWDEDLARAELSDALEKTRGCVIEVIMKDLHSCRGEPQRMSAWIRMAMELAEEFAG